MLLLLALGASLRSEPTAERRPGGTRLEAGSRLAFCLQHRPAQLLQTGAFRRFPSSWVELKLFTCSTFSCIRLIVAVYRRSERVFGRFSPVCSELAELRLRLHHSDT